MNQRRSEVLRWPEFPSPPAANVGLKGFSSDSPAERIIERDRPKAYNPMFEA